MELVDAINAYLDEQKTEELDALFYRYNERDVEEIFPLLSESLHSKLITEKKCVESPAMPHYWHQLLRAFKKFKAEKQDQIVNLLSQVKSMTVTMIDDFLELCFTYAELREKQSVDMVKKFFPMEFFLSALDNDKVDGYLLGTWTERFFNAEEGALVDLDRYQEKKHLLFLIDDLEKLVVELRKLSRIEETAEISELREHQKVRLLFEVIKKINNEDLTKLLSIKLVQRVLINQALTDDGIAQDRLLLLRQAIDFKDRLYGEELNELVGKEDWSEGKHIHYTEGIKVIVLHEEVKELFANFGSADEILGKMLKESFDLEESFRAFLRQSDYTSAQPLIDGLFNRPEIAERYREIASEAISQNINNENREDIAEWKKKARQLLLAAPTNRFTMYWLWDSLDLADYDRQLIEKIDSYQYEKFQGMLSTANLNEFCNCEIGRFFLIEEKTNFLADENRKKKVLMNLSNLPDVTREYIAGRYLYEDPKISKDANYFLGISGAYRLGRNRTNLSSFTDAVKQLLITKDAVPSNSNIQVIAYNIAMVLRTSPGTVDEIDFSEGNKHLQDQCFKWLTRMYFQIQVPSNSDQNDSVSLLTILNIMANKEERFMLILAEEIFSHLSSDYTLAINPLLRQVRDIQVGNQRLTRWVLNPYVYENKGLKVDSKLLLDVLSTYIGVGLISYGDDARWLCYHAALLLVKNNHQPAEVLELFSKVLQEFDIEWVKEQLRKEQSK